MAGRLIRKQFLISPEQDAKLARLSAEQKISAGELVRRAIDAYDDAGDESQLAQALEGASALVRESLTALERSGDRLREACRRLDDPNRRQAIQTAVRAELKEDPAALARLRAALSGLVDTERGGRFRRRGGRATVSVPSTWYPVPREDGGFRCALPTLRGRPRRRPP